MRELLYRQSMDTLEQEVIDITNMSEEKIKELRAPQHLVTHIYVEYPLGFTQEKIDNDPFL